MPKGLNKRSRWKAMMEFLRRRFLKKPKRTPEDPYADPDAYVTAPLRRGPKGRSGAAVAEFEDDDSYRAFPPRQR
jgi:hypothetical protein